MIRVTVWVDAVTCYGLGQSVALGPDGEVKTGHFTPAVQNRDKCDKAVSGEYKETFSS